MQIKNIIKLLWSFFKIGMVAFGGGYTVIPLLQREAVEYRHWISAEELSDIMAISQTMPGVIFVNSATMIGYRVGGVVGAIAATTAAVTPTIILTLLVTICFWNYTDLPLIKKTFTGVLLGVTALIIYSIAKMWRTVIKQRFYCCLVIMASLVLIVWKINVVIVILGVALVGYIYNRYTVKSGRDE